MDFLVVAYVAQFCTSSVDYIKKKNKLRHVQYYYVWEIRWTRTEKGHIDLAKTPLNHPIKQFGKKLKRMAKHVKKNCEGNFRMACNCDLSEYG